MPGCPIASLRPYSSILTKRSFGVSVLLVSIHADGLVCLISGSLRAREESFMSVDPRDFISRDCLSMDTTREEGQNNMPGCPAEKRRRASKVRQEVRILRERPTDSFERRNSSPIQRKTIALKPMRRARSPVGLLSDPNALESETPATEQSLRPTLSPRRPPSGAAALLRDSQPCRCFFPD